MTTFSTPQPITATLQLAAGDIELRASERADTVVEIAPSYALNDADVAAAEQTRVEYANGALHVIGAKGRGIGLLRKPGSVRVTVWLPSGSAAQASTGLGRVTSSGRLGECRVRSGAGDIQIADAASLDVATGIGEVAAHEIAGDVRCKTGSGGVRIAVVGGATHVRNSNGDTYLGDAHGSTSVKSSNGKVTIDRARADVRAATAHGNLTVGSVEGGVLDLKTAMGRIEIGVREGTAARLDLHTSFGNVISDLAPTDGPAGTGATVEIVARTSAGDIVIARAEQGARTP
jgi:DUF4097 and DUF4098 domain-containing protein YvlB